MNATTSDCDDDAISRDVVDRGATVRVIACFIAAALALVATLVALNVRARRRKLLAVAGAGAGAGGHRASAVSADGWFAVWGPDGRQQHVAVRCDVDADDDADDDDAPDAPDAAAVVVVVDA